MAPRLSWCVDRCHCVPRNDVPTFRHIRWFSSKFVSGGDPWWQGTRCAMSPPHWRNPPPNTSTPVPCHIVIWSGPQQRVHSRVVATNSSKFRKNNLLVFWSREKGILRRGTPPNTSTPVRLSDGGFPGRGVDFYLVHREFDHISPLHFPSFFWGVRLFGVFLRPARGLFLLGTCFCRCVNPPPPRYKYTRTLSYGGS